MVGAGPAGCAAAYYLARRGVDVVVLERATFPRSKVCGDGVAPRAVRALHDMGLEQELEQAGYRRIRAFRVVGSWGEAVKAGIRRRNCTPDYAYVVPRSHLDDMLVAAVRRRGARVIEGVRAQGALTQTRGSRLGVTALKADGSTFVVKARVVVAADGSRGSFSRGFLPRGALTPSVIALRAYMAGVEEVDDALHFFLDKPLLPGYGWIFPGGRRGAPANVGVGMPVPALRRRKMGLRDVFSWFLGPESVAAAHLARARIIDPPQAFPLQLRYVRGRRRVGPILTVGDAANLINPLSGEGIAYALESGRIAADAIMHAFVSGPRVLSSYERRIDKAFAVDYLEGYALRRILSVPWVNGGVVRLLSRDERLAMGAMGILTNTIPPGRLLQPSLWTAILAPSRLRATLHRVRPARG